VNRSAARGLVRKRKTTKRPRLAPMYLIARGPRPHTIAYAHEDESLAWKLTIAPLGSPPTEVPTRPAQIRREVREWLATDSQSFREANARGMPLTPFPPTPTPPTTAQKAAALKATALRKARERSYEPGRLGTGAAGGYLEALRGLVGDGRGTEGGVGHKGVPRLLRDAFLAESHFREYRERAGSLEKWARLAVREGLIPYASISFQDEAGALGREVEILNALLTRPKTPEEARAYDRQKTLVKLSSKRLADAVLGSPPPGRKDRSKNRVGRTSFAAPRPTSPR
jgi:hypothetical protein